MKQFLIVAAALGLLAGSAQAQILPLPGSPPVGPEKPRHQPEFAPVQHLRPLESMKPLEGPRTPRIEPLKPASAYEYKPPKPQSVYTMPSLVYPEANHQKQPASSYAPPN
jgi:hypothetical protein